MSVTDAAKEIFHKEVDKTKENKEYDEKLVLQKTKEELSHLKEDVSYATTVLEELRKTGWVDAQKFQLLDVQLRSTDKKKEAIQEIIRVVDDIYRRYDTLHIDEREKVKTMASALHESNNSIAALKNEVLNKTNYESIEKELDKELIDDALPKLKEHRYTRRLTQSWIVDSYKKHIHEKVEEMKMGKKENNKNNREKFVASLKDWFFGLLGTLFVGKKVADILAEKFNLTKDNVKEGAKKAVAAVNTATDTIKGMGEKGKEIIKSPEELKLQSEAARKYIKTSVKKYFHKDLDEQQIERIAQKMKIMDQLKDGTSEWSKIIDGAMHGKDTSDLNYLDATFQTVAMPLEMTFHLIAVLDEEGIIDMKQAAVHIVGNTVEYGLK